jgi:hypothetical protein
MTAQVRVGPWSLALPEVGNPAYAISIYAREKLDDVDHYVRGWWPLQAIVVFLCAGVALFALIRLWKSCMS